MKRPFLASMLVCTATLLVGGAVRAESLEEVLPLCSNHDASARIVCIHEIVQNGDPDRRALPALTDLAAHDPANHSEAASAITKLYGIQPPAYQPSAAGADPSRTRILGFWPSAWSTAKGDLSAEFTDLYLVNLSYGVGDHVELGLETNLPIGGLLLLPNIKLSLPTSFGAVALDGFAGSVFSFSGNSEHVLFFGGGPALSVGNPDSYVDAGVYTFGFNLGSGAASATAGVLFPYVGLSVRQHRLGFSLQLSAPGTFAYDTGDSKVELGHVLLAFYGARIVGDRIWANIGFLAPFYSGAASLYRIFPLGIPWLSFGFST